MPKQVIKCQDCGEEFIFSENDQKFYQEKGFQPPKRCKNCRNIRKDKRFERKEDQF